MNLTLLHALARQAQRDGLTLQWSIVTLVEHLERNQQRLGHQREQDSRTGDRQATHLQLENEALALVLTAVIKAYPAGADITIP